MCESHWMSETSLLNKWCIKSQKPTLAHFIMRRATRLKFSFSRWCVLFWQRLVLLWLHNLCWYGCCLNKQQPETSRCRGCIMMKLWLHTVLYTLELMHAWALAIMCFFFEHHQHFTPFRSLLFLIEGFLSFLQRNFRREKNCSTSKLDTVGSMWKNRIDRSMRKSLRKRKKCITRGKIYGTIQCSKHHKISKDRLFVIGGASRHVRCIIHNMLQWCFRFVAIDTANLFRGWFAELSLGADKNFKKENFNLAKEILTRWIWFSCDVFLLNLKKK